MAAATTIMKRKKMEAALAAEAGAPALAPAAQRPPEEKKERSSNPVVRLFEGVLEVLNSMTLQTAMYIFFVGLFQLLVSCMRLREEFYLCAAPKSQSLHHTRARARRA